MLKTILQTFFGDTINSKIRVTIINRFDNSFLEQMEIEQYDLSEDFSFVKSIILYGTEWLLVNAQPSHADQYSFSKKLILEVVKSDVVSNSIKVDHPADVRITFNQKPGN